MFSKLLFTQIWVHVLLFCFVGSTHGYVNTIMNRLKPGANIQVEIHYSGESVASCRPDYMEVPARQDRDINAYGCCIEGPIKITALDGINAKASTLFYPRRTGYGLSCASNKIVVQDLGTFGIFATALGDHLEE